MKPSSIGGRARLLATSTHLRSLFWAAVLAITAYRSAHYLFVSERIRWPIDFEVFWLAGGRPLHAIYAAGEMPFVYPPTSLFLFKPFSLFPFYPSYIAWAALSVMLFGVAVARTCGGKVSALCFLSPAANHGIMLGQSAMLLGGALFASLRLPPLAMGVIFGLVATVKPQLVLFAPFAFLIRGDWKIIGGMLGTWGLAFLASLVAFGPARWAEWINSFSHFHDVLIQFNVLSLAITPAARAEYLGLPVLPILLAGTAIGLAGVLAMARRVEGEMLIALIVGASFAAAPYAHTHDTIALIPACVVLLKKGCWPLAVIAALIVTGTPAGSSIGLLAGMVAACIIYLQRERGGTIKPLDDKVTAARN